MNFETNFLMQGEDGTLHAYERADIFLIEVTLYTQKNGVAPKIFAKETKNWRTAYCVTTYADVRTKYLREGI